MGDGVRGPEIAGVELDGAAPGWLGGSTPTRRWHDFALGPGGQGGDVAALARGGAGAKRLRGARRLDGDFVVRRLLAGSRLSVHARIPT
jgi:hypothetical protein